MDTERLTPDEAEAIRAAFLDKVCAELFPPDLPDPHRTLYFRILDELSRDAVQHTLAEATMDARALTQALQDIDASVLNWIQAAGDEWASMAVWRHKHVGAAALEDWSSERIEWLGRALESYLAQPARSVLLDRVLVDMLMALSLRTLTAKLSPTPGSQGDVTDDPEMSLARLLLSILARSLLTMLALVFLFFAVRDIDADSLDIQWAAAVATLVIVATLLAMPLVVLNRLGKWGRAQERRRVSQHCVATSDAYAVLGDEAAAVSTAALRTALDVAKVRGASWIGVELVINDLRRREIVELPALARF